MKIIIFKAQLTLSDELKPIRAGFRPTLVVATRKVLCNIDEVNPEPLGSGQRGTATIRIGWDSDESLGSRLDDESLGSRLDCCPHAQVYTSEMQF
jgi:hypothetical protein